MSQLWQHCAGIPLQIRILQTSRQYFRVNIARRRSTMPDNGGWQRGVNQKKAEYARGS
jgi:hypothetical protein